MSNKKNSKNKEALTEQFREKEEVKIMKQLDPTHLKEDIYNLRTQLLNLVARKSEVKQQIEKENESYLKETYDLQRTIKIQEDTIIDLESQFKLLERASSETLRTRKQKWEEQMEETVARKKTEKGKIMNDYQAIKRKVEHMKLFKEREKEYEKKVQFLQGKLRQTEQSHVKDIEKIKSEHDRNRQGLADEASRQMESIKESQVNRLQSSEEMSREQHIKKQNEVISEEIALCESEKSVLERECQHLLRAITDEKGKPSHNQLQSQANETYERSLRVIKLQGKLAKLKAYLNEETERLDEEFKKMESSYGQKEKDLEDTIAKTQGGIRMRDRDNKKVKACSQMVLNQRSHLESYMLQVLHEHPEIDPKDQRNMNQMLRLLFIKINSNKQPVNYKHYLPTPQNSQVSNSSSFD